VFQQRFAPLFLNYTKFDNHELDHIRSLERDKREAERAPTCASSSTRWRS